MEARFDLSYWTYRDLVSFQYALRVAKLAIQNGCGRLQHFLGSYLFLFQRGGFLRGLTMLATRPASRPVWIALNRDEAPDRQRRSGRSSLALPILMPTQALVLQI